MSRYRLFLIHDAFDVRLSVDFQVNKILFPTGQSLFFAIRGSDVLLIFSLPSRGSLLTISNNTLEHQILDFCSFFLAVSSPLLLHLPDLCIHSKDLSDSSIPVSLPLRTFPPLTPLQFLFNTTIVHLFLPLSIPPHASDLRPTVASSTTQTTSFKMPPALSDTQNRYLAMAWLCIDAEPKVNNHISFAHNHPTISKNTPHDPYDGPKLTCLFSHSQINYEKFSQLTGSKTANSAREMLRVTRKKLLEFDNATSTTDGTMAPPNTPAAKTPRKKATPKTQSTKGKTAAKKRKVAVYSDDSEDDDESPIKKKTVVKAEPVNEDSEAGAGADSDDAEV
jgi:hypothetical protein